VHIVVIDMTNVSCFTSYAYVDCTLCIEFLNDCDRLHGSTLPYVILVIEVSMFIDCMCYA
jgi:hypothetical protein